MSFQELDCGGISRSARTTRLCHGTFEIDPNLFELRKHGRVVRIQRKPLALLIYLARNASRVVPATELKAELWPGVTVGEESLRQVTVHARKAIEDHDRATLVTVRGYGYRLVTERPATRLEPCFSARVEASCSRLRNLSG